MSDGGTTSVRELAAFGGLAPAARARVSRPNALQIVGDAIQSAYYQELLGPRTFGSLLNIGAGGISEELHHQQMFAASEYHTFEMPGCPLAATYLGSVNDMCDVASERYDWVLSSAMLEHIEDPWSAAREMTRVTKVGGFLYVTAPFSQIVHYEPRYRDYWRFTPMGFATLFPQTAVLEVEAWGDNPAEPDGYAVLLQRSSSPQRPPYAPRSARWIDFPHEQPWQIYRDEPHTAFDWPVYELALEPMALAHQLHNARNEYGLRAGLPAKYDDVMRAHKHQFARLIGTLGIRGGLSYYERAHPGMAS